MWNLTARPVICVVCCLLASLPLFGKPLPEAPNRPERTHHLAPVPPDPRRAADNRPRTGPLPPLQGHEGPEVFSIRVHMHPLLERYLALYTSPAWKAWLAMVIRRARPFLGYVRSQVARYRLPPALRFLPIAESSYDPFAVSKAGAAGLWQLMPKTGDAYGLHINGWVDQRFDFWKATDASLATLKHNRRVLGNWLLALAAYDAGLDFMKTLVAETGIHNYWTLARRGYLPHETVDYVPRFLALAAICSYPGRYGLPITWRKPMKWTRIKLSHSVDLRLLAQEAKIKRSLLMEGNAGYLEGITPPQGSRYYLKVPQRDAGGVDKLLHTGRDSLMLFYVYAVKKGDRLPALAHYYGVPVQMILRYNPHVRPRHLTAGTWLLIPAVKNVRRYRTAVQQLTPAQRQTRARLRARFSSSYTVQPGDTLWSIASRFHTSPAKVAEANGIEENGIIHPGMVLHVPPG